MSIKLINKRKIYKLNNLNKAKLEKEINVIWKEFSRTA